MILRIFYTLQTWLNYTRVVDFLAPLALRLYLVPIFWMSGTVKWNSIDNVANWFGNPDWGLGLPFPYVMAYAATLTEILGAVFLLFGFAVRWISLPLMITMIVAITMVHWDNGWLAIAGDNSPETIQLNEFLTWLQDTHPQRYQHLTTAGTPVMLNNGVEFGVTYFIMLLVLFFQGGGKYLSMDYWIKKWADKKLGK